LACGDFDLLALAGFLDLLASRGFGAFLGFLHLAALALLGLTPVCLGLLLLQLLLLLCFERALPLFGGGLARLQVGLAAGFLRLCALVGLLLVTGLEHRLLMCLFELLPACEFLLTGG
jgi:hypothetical protein